MLSYNMIMMGPKEIYNSAMLDPELIKQKRKRRLEINRLKKVKK